MNLPLKSCRGQCFDGAANMAGNKRGVATQILTAEPRALYTHCYGHSLNLAMCDTIKKCRLTRDALDVTNEISKLIKFSPKRKVIFDKIKEEISRDSPGFRVLCPTRWAVRAKSLKSIQSNYSVLQGLWQAVLDDNVHPEVRTRVIGVQTKKESFDFLFGISLAELVLSHGDNLSATLQSSTISATEGQDVASMTIQTLKQLLTKEKLYLFWNLVQKKAGEIDVSEPSLPRPRKVPKRFETDDAVVHFPATVEEYYHDIYFEA